METVGSTCTSDPDTSLEPVKAALASDEKQYAAIRVHGSGFGARSGSDQGTALEIRLQ